jgi:hypothetical protein
MFKKTTLMAGLAISALALALPAGASAEWTDKGAKLVKNEAVAFAGNTSFVSNFGGINCTETTATGVLEPGINGKITSFAAINQTTKCDASGGLAFCTTHSVTPTNINWAIQTNTASITISGMHVDTTFTGAFCPYHEITLKGNVGALPNNLTAVGSVALFGAVEVVNSTTGAAIGQAQMGGTWNVTPAGTYGIK